MSRAMVAGSFAVAALMLLAAMSQSARPAFAAFHCMRIHAVMGGFEGNDDVQFVELRMTSPGGQNLVGGHKLTFLDAAGTPKAVFTFPANVSNAATGDSILIATEKYNDDYSPGHNADFEFAIGNTTGADPLTPVQGPDGKIVFGVPPEANCTAQQPLDSVTYGTTAVVADWTTGLPAAPNNKAPALPSTNQGVRLSNLSTTVTNNGAEYSLQNASTTTETITTGFGTDFRFPRNNARVLSAVLGPGPVGGTVAEPDAPDQESLPASQTGDDGGVPKLPIIAVTVAVIAAGIALGALETRRRRRA